VLNYGKRRYETQDFLLSQPKPQVTAEESLPPIHLTSYMV
jgi:hypothetical protein